MGERTLWEAPRSSVGGRGGRRGRGGRNRGRGGHQLGSGELWDANSAQRPPRITTPVILSKPQIRDRERDVGPTGASGSLPPGRIQIKKRDDAFPRQRGSSPSRPNSTGTPPSGSGVITISRRPSAHTDMYDADAGDSRYQQHGPGVLQPRRPVSGDDENRPSRDGVPVKVDLPPHMRWVQQMPSVPCVKMLDEWLKWDERGVDILQDQTEFLVVGVLGMQGVGKSTIMSLLAGTRPQQVVSRAQPFKTSSRDTLECAMHQTCGIDMAVSAERVILLDTQPILSMSVLDRLHQHERQIPVDMKVDSYAELQASQIAAFLFSVCHVVIVVQDWLYNVDVFNFLLTAEMLKPSPPQPVKSDVGGGAGFHVDTLESFPHCLFVYNRVSSDDFSLASLRTLHQVTKHKFKHSKLGICSGASLLRSGLLPCEEHFTSISASDANVFLLPSACTNKPPTVSGASARRHGERTAGSLPGSMFTLFPHYRGHPSFATLAEQFCYQVLSLPRRSLSPHGGPLTETQWFHFAARMWDSIKKSGLMSDYSRLLHE